MRFRFSLRKFFVLVALVAAFCYYWFVRPTAIARQFIEAIATKDYAAADQCFQNADDHIIANSAKKYWAFAADAKLSPVSFGQLVRGQRHVRLNFRYFHLDQNVVSQADMAATALGLSSPTTSNLRSAMIIDRSSEFNPTPQR